MPLTRCKNTLQKLVKLSNELLNCINYSYSNTLYAILYVIMVMRLCTHTFKIVFEHTVAESAAAA
jgi:hypothetical protein